MTLAPSANSNVELLTGELKQFNSEEELYGYLDQLSHDVDGVSFLDKAKAAVNAWWVRAIVGVANADKFYGFDTDAGNGLNRENSTPELLKKWYSKVGLSDGSKLKRARSAARTWLALDAPNCQELVDSLGIEKLRAIGMAPKNERASLVDHARSSSTLAVKAEVAKIKSSSAVLRAKLAEATEILVQRQAAYDKVPKGQKSRNHEGFTKVENELRSAKNVVSRLTTELSRCEGDESINTAAEDADATDTTAILKERKEYAKEAADAKAKAEALEAELKALKENTPDPVDEKAIQEAALKVANEEAELKIKLATEAAAKEAADAKAKAEALEAELKAVKDAPQVDEKAKEDAVAKALADYKAEQQKLKEAAEAAEKKAAAAKAKADKDAATKKAEADKKAREKAIKDALDAYKNQELAKLNVDPQAVAGSKLMLQMDIHAFKKAAERFFICRGLPDENLPSMFQLEMEAAEAMGQWFEVLSDENLNITMQLLEATIAGRKKFTSIHSINEEGLVTINV